MFIPIFKDNVQGRKHRRCAFAVPVLLSQRRPKCVVQNEWNGHKYSKNNRKHHHELELYHGISKTNT